MPKRVPTSSIEVVTSRNIHPNAYGFVLTNAAVTNGFDEASKVYTSAHSAAFNWIQLKLYAAHNIVKIEVLLR